MTKVLVIRFSSIGDIVLTTPLLRCLKMQMHEGVEIHYICKKQFASLLTANPHIDKILTIEKTTREVADSISAENYDFFIDLHRNLRSAMIKKRHKALDFTVEKLNWEKWLWVNFGINKMPDKHIVDRYMDTIKGFGIENDGKGLEYYFGSDSEVDLSKWKLNSNQYIVWVIASAHEGKRFSEEKMKEVLVEINYPVVLIGGESEAEMGERLSGLFPHVSSASGALSIDQSARLIKEAKLVVTPDTGMMHIAAALKKTIISIWGCTVPGFGMYPYLPGRDSLMIEPENLSKRPCSKLGNKCKYPGNCINRIETKKLMTAINLRI